MIFVTVGTQLPFERLIAAVDEWAEKNPETPVFAQVGDTKYVPQHMTFVRKITPREYSEKFNNAQVVVSHAGMGTIISGLENAKPLVLMPRLEALGEHRNDHQVGTAGKFSHYAQIHIVNNAQELHEVLSACLQDSQVAKGTCPAASMGLIEKIRAFVDDI